MIIVGVGLAFAHAIYSGAPDDFVLTDAPAFSRALEDWSKALVSDRELATPRELKRFMNKARYFAVRLSEPEQRSKEDGPSNALEPSQPIRLIDGLDEALVVALTAVHHLRPQWLRDRWFFDKDPEEGKIGQDRAVFQAVSFAIEAHRARRPWPKESNVVDRFLAVADEFQPTPVEVPHETLASPGEAGA